MRDHRPCKSRAVAAPAIGQSPPLGAGDPSGSGFPTVLPHRSPLRLAPASGHGARRSRVRSTSVRPRRRARSHAGGSSLLLRLGPALRIASIFRGGVLTRTTAIFLLLVLLPFLGARCTKGIPKNVAERLKPVTIEWWGVQDTEEEMAPIIAEYRKAHPNVTVTYRRFRFPEYERRLLEALAEGQFRGPDVFAVPSTWTRKMRSRLLPAPPTITMPFREIRGRVKQEVYAELRTTRTPSPQELSNLFVDAVAPDAVLDTEGEEGTPSRPAIFGLPRAVDTLVLYANRDLLNAAGIPEPAKTWPELQAHVPRLTKVGADGKIVQSGAAIGTTANVQRAFDILSLLMMQNGAVMVTPSGEPMFHRIPEALAGQRQSAPGLDALRYYADFADRRRATFTWDADQPDSVEAFLQGRVAYLMGYSYHLPIIRGRAPRLNLSVSGIPHLAAAVDPQSGTVVGSDVSGLGGNVAITYANVWLDVVAERTKIPNEAWDLVLFATTRVPVVREYLNRAQRPTALRALVGEQLQDPTLKVFASQLLTSRTWYRGRNPEAAEEAFRQMVDDVLAGRGEPARALELAAEKVAQTR